MRVSIPKNDLARLVSSTAKAVESRNTLPILACVRLVVASGRVTATATDLEIEIQASAPCEAAEDGGFCVDAKLLAGIVSKAAGDTIAIDYDGSEATLKAGRSKFKLPTLPAEDFPKLDAGTFGASFEADLSALFAPVQFAMSDEETRYYLRGVFLQPGAATATDGHRLATRAFDPLGEFEPVIIPRKTVGILPKGAATVELSSTKIRLTAGGMQMTSRLIDGTFPDYERVIPGGNDKVVTFDGDALKAAVTRVAVVSNERGKSVKLTVREEEIELWQRGEGEATDSVPASYRGPALRAADDPLSIGFNGSYLADALGALPAGQVDLAIADAGSPALLTSQAAEGLRIVCMPMRF